MLIATPVLFAAIGFVIGHYTGAREPFYFIGAPVDPTAASVARSTEANNQRSTPGSETLDHAQGVISGSEASTVCGAPTKSGRPCKRKVKGGGYCWQHRNGQSPKEEADAER